MLNPSAWNWGNYAGFFWVSFDTISQLLLSTHNVILQAGSCFLCFIYTYFRVPEPAGRTFAELDLLFEQKVSARKFATTDVDVFAEHVEEVVMRNYEDQLALSNTKTIV